MDRSALSRGEPTVNATHGDAAAIGFGDVLMARSVRAGLAAGAQAVARWAATLEDLCRGQLGEPALMAATPADRVQCASLKTGALMGFSAEAGALGQGAGAQASRSWSEAGLALGLGYQYADDLLDHVGDPKRLGKPTQADLPRGIVSIGLRRVLAARGLGHRRARTAATPRSLGHPGSDRR